MSRSGDLSLPPGYRRIHAGSASGIALEPVARAVEQALAAGGTLHDYAASHPARRAFMGRGVAWSVPLPGGVAQVVVRRSRHGGLLAPITGERFLLPTRAPHELAAALRLRDMDIPTPEVLAYALYPAGPFLRRFDMATREVPGGSDLPEVLQRYPAGDERTRALDATGALVRTLALHGVRHPDLNMKNVLIATQGGGCVAWLLDVDRVRFREPGSTGVARANRRRILRSAMRWRERGLPLTGAELALLSGSRGEAAG